MPRYPFTPELLDALPEELAERFRSLEAVLLEEICSRLRIADDLNQVTVEDIRALRAHGISLEEIRRAIQETEAASSQRLNALFEEVAARNQAYYAAMVDIAQVTRPAFWVGPEDVEAIRRQTQEEFTNITQSMGFQVGRGPQKRLLPPGRAYQWALDNAEMQVMSGAISYSQAIYTATKQLADSGLRVVSYASGHHDQVDVAVRRAVLTGVNQVNQKYREQSMEYLGTELVEVTAHRGARDVDGPNGWENHKKWQGRVYRWDKYKKPSQGATPPYPDFVTTCGLGSVTGIGGANCRHSFWPFIEGVSERAYTEAELENIDPPPFQFEGKTYTRYEATQKQRMIERTVRKLKRERAAFRAAGLKDEERAVSVRIKRLGAEYKAFSKAAGLPQQRERMEAVYT